MRKIKASSKKPQNSDLNESKNNLDKQKIVRKLKSVENETQK